MKKMRLLLCSLIFMALALAGCGGAQEQPQPKAEPVKTHHIRRSQRAGPRPTN